MQANLLSVAAALFAVALISMPAAATPPLMSVDGSTGNNWEHGLIATGAGTGDTGWATKLNGNYGNSRCDGVQNTVAVPGAVVLANPVMVLEHGYNFEKSAFGTTYDAGVIVISKDNGATWSHLAGAAYTSFSYSTSFGLQNCLLATYGIGQGTGLYSGVAALGTETISLAGAGIAEGDLVIVKFVAATDNSVLRDGWAITGLSIAGVPLSL